MRYRAMIIIRNLPVIGWVIRTVIWVKDGVEYLWDERKDRQRYGKPLRFWMIWRKLGREMNLGIREGAEKERNRKGARERTRKERGRGWVRGIQWVDRGVRGAEDRREMWLHDGRRDNVRVELEVDGQEVDGQEEEGNRRFWAAVDFGKQHPEVMFKEYGVNKGQEESGITQGEMVEAEERIRAANRKAVVEFMESYGRGGLVGKKVSLVIDRNQGKTQAAEMVKEVMEAHGIEVKEVGKTYGERLG